MRNSIKIFAQALIVLLTLGVLMPSQATAQTVSIGLKAGVGDNHHFNPNDEFKAPGPQAGLFAIYSDREHLGFGTEIFYAMKRTRPDINGTRVEIRADYIEIPVLGYYFFGDFGDKIRPKAFAGPHVAFMVNEHEEENNLKPSLRTFDFGMTLGGGVNVQLSRQLWLNTDLRYAAGFLPIRKDIYAEDNQTFRNQNFSILAGIAIGLDRVTD